MKSLGRSQLEARRLASRLVAVKVALTLAAAGLLSGGCALPLPVVVGSYAMDGVLVFVSGKTITDHAISDLTAHDCAMWRLVDGGPICFAPVGEPLELRPAAFIPAPVISAPTISDEPPPQQTALLPPG